MRTLLGWIFKASFVGVIYLGVTAGGFKVKLPDEVLGYKVPEAAQQWVDRTTQIADFGKQTQAGFKGIADSFK
jgi:hypothetical protein